MCSRTYLLFTSEEVGGQQAADKAASYVESIVQYRKIAAPTSAEEVLNSLRVDPTVLAEAHKQQQAIRNDRQHITPNPAHLPTNP